MKEQEGRNGQVLKKFCKKFVPTFFLFFFRREKKFLGRAMGWNMTKKFNEI